jgi:hypothetical protein
MSGTEYIKKSIFELRSLTNEKNINYILDESQFEERKQEIQVQLNSQVKTCQELVGGDSYSKCIDIKSMFLEKVIKFSGNLL